MLQLSPKKSERIEEISRYEAIDPEVPPSRNQVPFDPHTQAKSNDNRQVTFSSELLSKSREKHVVSKKWNSNFSVD